MAKRNDRSKLLSKIPDEEFNRIMWKLRDLRKENPSYPDHELLIFLVWKENQ